MLEIQGGKIVLHDKDKDGDIEITMSNDYTFINENEAIQIVDFLTK